MEILRIGLIGAGGNTRLRHIPGFLKCEGVEVVVLCKRSMESSQKVADEFGIPRVAGDLRLVQRYLDAVRVAGGGHYGGDLGRHTGERRRSSIRGTR